MEKKIMSFEAEVMLKEFIRRSFLPNNMSINFQTMFYKNLENLNNNLLLSDLKKLYTDKNSLKSFEKNCNVIIINSKNDLILDQDSSDDFIELLKKTLTKKPTLIELDNQGHCLTNLNFYQIIKRTLDNKYEK
jgi:pimeloyl-[acyl-carrier protein] methyl ester esterase